MIDDDALLPEGPHDADAALAGEYVLRLLGPEEAAACAEREARDPAFAALVAGWRTGFADLDGEFAPAAPPAGLQRRIEARLFGSSGEPSMLARLWRSAGLWRGLAAAAALVAVYLGTLAPQPPIGGVPEARLISALASIDSDVQLLLQFEPEAAVLTLNRLSGEPPPGQALELWVALGDEPPTSLGVLPEEQYVRIPLSGEQAERVSAGDHFAVSVEPPDGSPTGGPTGDIVARGNITEL